MYSLDNTLKNVLKILNDTDGYVTCDSICRSLGTSGEDVADAVRLLKAEGYTIHTSSCDSNSFCLMPDTDVRMLTELNDLISPARIKTVFPFKTLGSTNSFLKSLAENGAADGSAIIASAQTKGRGRRGNSFLSPDDKGLYLSFLMRPHTSPADTASITAWTAAAASSAIYTVCGVQPGIKWVNDLVMNGKKICGILTEISTDCETMQVQYVVIGIGINIAETVFPDSISSVASSILIETGKKVRRAELAAEIIKELVNLRSAWPYKKEVYLSSYRRLCITTGKQVCVISDGENKTAYAEKINDDFSLRLRYPDGSLRDASGGEISVRGFEGYV